MTGVQTCALPISTDNILSDPIYGMPAASILMYPALSYHSSYDTMERVDRSVLKRSAMIAGTYLYFIAAADAGNIRWLLDEIKAHAEKEVEARACTGEAQGYLAAHMFRNGCLSLANLVDCDALKAEIESTAAQLPVKELPEQFKLKDDSILQNGGKLVPIRLVKGTLNFSQFTKEQMAESKWHPSWNDALNIPLFWADGNRNMWEITCMSAMELGRDDGCV